MNTNKLLKIFNILMCLSMIFTVLLFYLMGRTNAVIVVILSATALTISLMINKNIEDSKNKLPL